MSESTVYQQRVLFGEENGEEELAVLPRRTKVVVTGNNRTRSVLVGLQGVVKKAVGLGGWHWLVLTNGDEVKVQRNALSVIEVPTGDEDDDDWEDFSYSGSDLGSRSTPRRTLTLDLRKLETASLWKYWRHFKLDEVNCRNYHPSKEQLVEAVERHFVSQLELRPLRIPLLILLSGAFFLVISYMGCFHKDLSVIAEFLHAAKRLKQLHGLSG